LIFPGGEAYFSNLFPAAWVKFPADFVKFPADFADYHRKKISENLRYLREIAEIVREKLWPL